MSLPSRSYTSSLLRPGSRARVLPKTVGVLLCLSAIALFGCKNDRRSLSGMTGTGLPGGDAPDPCATHQAGCACDTEGEKVDCGTVKEKTGDYVTCLVGSRVCASGAWSECAADHEDKRPAVYHAPMQGGFSLQGLGSAASCMNLCDPECDDVADTPNGLVVGSGLTATATGLTLAAGAGSGTCDVLDVTPATTSVVVSAIATNGAVTAAPAIVDHDGVCANGVTVQPSWTLNAYDRAVIDTAGKLQVYSGIAGPITVTGTAGTTSDTATVTVKVTVADRGTNATAATDLDGAGSGADTGKILYPYNNTVFPLDLEAPLVQWDRGPASATANNATEVQVALRYPANCAGPTAAVPTSACTFWYSKIYTGDPTCSPVLTSDGYTATSQCLYNSTTTPAWQIPQAVWSAFDRTVKNAVGGGEIVIQRRYGGSAKQEMKVAVKFASDSLKGTAYYTQYKRYLKSSSCPTAGSTNGRITSSYEPGNICPVGSCIQSITKGDSTTRDVDLTVTTPTNNNPFVDSSGTNTAGCPVCHSIAANGSRHVSVSQSSQTTGGGTSQGVNDITIVNGLARFTPITQPPNYAVPTGSSDSSYGFAYNAIFPDGSRVLQGANYWGSTQNTPSSNTAQAPNETGNTGKLKPYFTVNTTAGGAGVDYATTAPLSPTFTQSGNTLTPGSNGSLIIDGVSVSSGDAVLVKNEIGSNLRSNGVYTVSNAGSGSSKWSLTRRGDMDLANASELAVGTEVRVTDGDVNRGRTFYISALTGTLNATTATIVFSERLNTTHFGAAAAVTVDYASTDFLTPSPATLTGSVLAGAYPGPLVVEGHTMASMERLLVKDQANPVQNGIYTLTQAGAGGTGAAVTVDYATAAVLTAYTGTGTLTASAYGSLTVDGTTLALTDRVLLKNEGTGTPPRSARNGIYYVSQLGSTPTPSASTPANGAVKCATTANLSANYSLGILTATSNVAFGSATGADACPTVAIGNRILVKSQTTTQLNGIYAVTVVGSSSVPWKLTRSLDADVVGELTPLMQVSVTSGTANAGKTFYITTPATGTITPGSSSTGTAMSFSQANKWTLTRDTDTMSLGLQIVVSGGAANANKYFYMSYPTSGSVTLETTLMDFSSATPWQLTRTADTFTAGKEFDVLNGAENAGRGFYVSSPTTGAVTLGTTAMSFDSSGLPSMMVPVFSPDGTKVAYINGDADLQGGVGETGWRRGLSMFSFAWNAGQSTFAATAKKRLYSSYISTASAGMVLKWPFFESDSRSLLYVESATDEYCSSGDLTASPTTDAIRACYQGSLSSLGSRGEMTPTARGYRPGRVYSIDTQTPASTRVELAKLNDADGSMADADHAYQPTVLPSASGGYRWVVFTSTRAFGNQINARSYASATYGTATHFSCAAPMLWISALSDSTAATTDRSNPPFRLPGQYVARLATASADYINERGYLVPAPCKNTGATCSTNDDCCGSDAMPSATAACRAPAGWSPSSGPPAKTCQALSGTCTNTGLSCATATDCCSGVCVNFQCSSPASLGEATFTREYIADCPVGYKPRWLFFKYHLTTGSDSSIKFEAQSSTDLATLDAAKVVLLGTSTSDIVAPTTPESIDLSAKLIAKDVSNHLQYLRIDMTLIPSMDHATAPILRDWDTTYTCDPAE